MLWPMLGKEKNSFSRNPQRVVLLFYCPLSVHLSVTMCLFCTRNSSTSAGRMFIKSDIRMFYNPSSIQHFTRRTIKCPSGYYLTYRSVYKPYGNWLVCFKIYELTVVTLTKGHEIQVSEEKVVRKKIFILRRI